MDYRLIIAQSWEYTQKNKRLIFWLGFIPAIFTTIFSIGALAHQYFSFKSSYLFDNAEHSFMHDVIAFIWTFIQDHMAWTIPMIVLVAVFVIAYLLVPTFARASAIQMIARNRNGQKASVGTGVKHGVVSFLPLFEWHILAGTFSFFSMLFEMSFVLRNLGPVIFRLLIPVFLILIVISLFLTLLFIYTDFYIVVDGEGVFRSMKKSARLVFTNLQETFLITALMLIIGVRIIIQAIIVFLIPVLVVMITGYVAAIAVPAVGLIIGGILAVVGLGFASYLNGIVDIFSYTVWTFTFLELTSQKELSARESVVEELKEELEEVEEQEKEPNPYSGHGHKNL